VTEQALDVAERCALTGLYLPCPTESTLPWRCLSCLTGLDRSPHLIPLSKFGNVPLFVLPLGGIQFKVETAVRQIRELLRG
jgi:hypothetical protein